MHTQISDPFMAYGQPPVPQRNFKPSDPNRSSVITPEAVHRSTVFVTQVRDVQNNVSCWSVMGLCTSTCCAG